MENKAKMTDGAITGVGMGARDMTGVLLPLVSATPAISSLLPRGKFGERVW